MLQLILNVELSFEPLQSLHKGNDITHIPVRTHLKKQINF